MAENQKIYTIKDDGGVGAVKIADDVVAVIAGLAATEVKGVSSIAGSITNEMIPRKGPKALSKGVRITVSDNQVKADLSLIINYDCSVIEVCEAVQERVKNAIENMTGMKVIEVNVRVSGVETSKER
ncbi:MAG: Asp23/Gls24 family envelope stress response protein [Lachnospiraceae bacterium]|nr:Asp23/Gls24 family envelope stress response protein [Lachnospiraceae bacterium]